MTDIVKCKCGAIYQRGQQHACPPVYDDKSRAAERLDVLAMLRRYVVYNEELRGPHSAGGLLRELMEVVTSGEHEGEGEHD